MKNFKPRPLISGKTPLVALSSPKQKKRTGDHDQDGPTGKVQRQGLGEDRVRGI